MDVAYRILKFWKKKVFSTLIGKKNMLDSTWSNCYDPVQSHHTKDAEILSDLAAYKIYEKNTALNLAKIFSIQRYRTGI